MPHNIKFLCFYRRFYNPFIKDLSKNNSKLIHQNIRYVIGTRQAYPRGGQHSRMRKGSVLKLRNSFRTTF